MRWFKFAPWLALPLALPLALAACQRHGAITASNPGQVHYVREPAWLGDGKWFYPQEMTSLDQTGLASVAADDHPAVTTDGETYDPTALTAAHQTLQLPAIVTVTNLANGLQINVRVNDRGPYDPGRVIELSPRAAELLQIQDGTPAQVRVVLVPDLTQALANQLHGGSLQVAVNLAPVASVSSESLAPPPGVAQSARGGGSEPATTASDAPAPSSIMVPDRLPEQVMQTAPHPGQLYILVDDFAEATYAMREAAILAPYGSVQDQTVGGEERFLVRGGPYPTVADADAALKTALRLGLRGARIVVL